MHETYSEEGCTILAIYRKPNIFAKSAGFVTGGKVGNQRHNTTKPGAAQGCEQHAEQPTGRGQR